MSIPLSFDMSGYAYDVNNPTQHTERLSYCLYQILSNLQVEGYSIEEPVDPEAITATETIIQSMESSLRSQSQGGTQILFPEAPAEIQAEPSLYNLFVIIRNALSQASLDKWMTDQVHVENITDSQVDLSPLITTLATTVTNAIWGVAKSEGIITIGTHEVWCKSANVDESH